MVRDGASRLLAMRNGQFHLAKYAMPRGGFASCALTLRRECCQANQDNIRGSLHVRHAFRYRQIRRDLRRRRGRRGLCRHVHAAPVARAGHDGAGLRAGLGRRRHLVLEPLSRRALRRREHAIFLFILRRAAAGVGLERALRAAARDPEIRQPRRRPLRSAPRHPVQHPRRARGLRRDDLPVVGRDLRRQDGHGKIRRARHRLPVERADARHQGPRSIQGQGLSHRPLAARGGRFHRPACRRHRHRDRRRSSRCRSLPSRRAS